MNRQISAAEAIHLELMEARDQLIGLAAQDAERKFQFSRLRKEVRDLKEQSRKNLELLQVNMTKAYTAEKALAEANLQIVSLVENHKLQLATIYSSRSWRVGRIMTSPVRKVRHLLQR